MDGPRPPPSNASRRRSAPHAPVRRSPGSTPGEGRSSSCCTRFARSPELLTFAREQLGVLFEERDQRERELLRTLEIYLESGRRKAEAARACCISSASRCTCACSASSDCSASTSTIPDTVLGLHLAVRALRLTQALGPGERLG